MAKKKVRRSERPASTPRMVESEMPVKSLDLASEYRYVIRDLTQIAVIAGILVISLVVLSFVI